MRDRDRWWWLTLIAGLAFCSGGVVTPYIGLQIIPTDNPYMTSADYWELIGLYGFITLICLGGGLTFVIMAVHERRRHRMRLAALHGDVSVMPPAETHADPAMAPDVAEKPLVLMWRTGAATKVIYVPLLGLQTLGALISVGMALVGLVAPIFLPRQPSAEDLFNHALAQPMSVTEIILRVTGASVIVALVIVFGVLYVRVIPFLFGRPFGVYATNLGLDAHTEWGSRVRMAWDEMRLLEVVSGDLQSQRRFALYAPCKRIRWAEYRSGLGAEYVPVDVTASEMTLRQAALLSLITAKTGLAPRTLAKTLERRPATARTVKRSSQAVTLLVFALILAGIAVADFFFSVTPVPWVNWVSTGSLALATLCLIVASVWMALAKPTLPAHARPPSVGAPSLDAPGVSYILSWRTPLLRRLALICIGLCLAVNLVPGV